MANATRTAMSALAIVMVLAAVKEGEAAGRVTSENPAVAALINDTARRSSTFQQMIAAIEANHGLVYVSRGRCGHGVRACLALSVEVAGPNRLLRIILDDRKSDAEAMHSLGHELRHVLEVLAEPSVTSGVAMRHFYLRTAMRQGDSFETTAAIIAGDTVRAELRKRTP